MCVLIKHWHAFECPTTFDNVILLTFPHIIYQSRVCSMWVLQLQSFRWCEIFCSNNKWHNSKKTFTQFSSTCGHVTWLFLNYLVFRISGQTFVGWKQMLDRAIDWELNLCSFSIYSDSWIDTFSTFGIDRLYANNFKLKADNALIHIEAYTFYGV